MRVTSQLKHLLDFVGLLYVRWLCSREYSAQKFSGVNERPIELSFVFRKLAEVWPRDVLDVGTGKTALPHLVRNCGFLVTAIDNIQDYRNKGMFNRHYHILNDDITDTALIDTYDFIICVSVLEHIQNFAGAMKSMSKLLKDGGDLVITFPYNHNKYCPNVYDLPESSVTMKFGFVTQAFSWAEISKWIQECGFKIMEQEYWDFFDGEYWTCGKRLMQPQKVGAQDRHQLTCIH